METNQNHNLPDQLQAYLDQALDPPIRKQVEEHLDACSTCREELTRFENLVTRLERLPEVSTQKDFSLGVLTQLRVNKKPSQGLTWALLIEVIAAAVVLGLTIPAFQGAFWIPKILDAQLEIRAAINIFLTQLASSWMLRWAQMQINLTQLTKSFQTLNILPSTIASSWILILAAAAVGILANYFLLRSNTQIRKPNHNG